MGMSVAGLGILGLAFYMIFTIVNGLPGGSSIALLGRVVAVSIPKLLTGFDRLAKW